MIIILAIAADIWIRTGALAALLAASAMIVLLSVLPDFGVGQIWSRFGRVARVDRVMLEPVWNGGIMLIDARRRGEVHYQPQGGRPVTIERSMMRQPSVVGKAPDEAAFVEITERHLPTVWRIVDALIAAPWRRRRQMFFRFHVDADQCRVALPVHAMAIGDEIVAAGDFYRRLRPRDDAGPAAAESGGPVSC